MSSSDARLRSSPTVEDDAQGRPLLCGMRCKGRIAVGGIRKWVFDTMRVSGRRRHIFSAQAPAPMPSPLTRVRLEQLMERPRDFVITPKADGTFYAVYACRYEGQPVTIFISRNFAMHAVVSMLPHEAYDGTLLFVELVYVAMAGADETAAAAETAEPAGAASEASGPQSAGPSKRSLCALVFDAARVAGEDMYTDSIEVRRARIQALLHSGVDADTGAEDRPHFLLNAGGSAATAVPLQLKPTGAEPSEPAYPADGVIVYQKNAPLGVGRQDSLWRVKGGETVDLLFSNGKWYMYTNGEPTPVPPDLLDIQRLPSDMRCSNGDVVEMSVSVRPAVEGGEGSNARARTAAAVCTPLGIRRDKSCPNDLSTLRLIVSRPLTLQSEGVLGALRAAHVAASESGRNDTSRGEHSADPEEDDHHTGCPRPLASATEVHPDGAHGPAM